MQKGQQVSTGRRQNPRETGPAAYALTMPGLETIAAEEIRQELNADVKRTGPGLVVFRTPHLDRSLLQLRTVEDVFLLAWGTDQLTRRASKDLDAITRWTARKPDWTNLLRLHHAIRPKPQGRPTYHLVTQMQGRHVYRRVDALRALARGLAGKFPVTWRPVNEDASVEVWLTIHEATAICGLRLSDKTMRHRQYQAEHRPASLRPVVAAAMVRIANPRHDQILLDPMCGAGTILAERLLDDRTAPVFGGDIDADAVRAAYENLRGLVHGDSVSVALAVWDARHLPLRDDSIARLACNLPFGKQLGEPESISVLYDRSLREFDRVLQSSARAVLLASDLAALEHAAHAVGWRLRQKLPLRVLGQRAVLTLWNKG
jgi:23S rRNA G2445 N2-methylase RlmL